MKESMEDIITTAGVSMSLQRYNLLIELLDTAKIAIEGLSQKTNDTCGLCICGRPDDAPWNVNHSANCGAVRAIFGAIRAFQNHDDDWSELYLEHNRELITKLKEASDAR